MAITYLSTSFGCWEIEGSEQGVSRVQLTDRNSCPDEPIPDCLLEAAIQLEEYFQQKRTSFDLRLHLVDAPPFYRSVWRLMQEIPYGQTTTYSGIANKLHSPDAVRAVGQAGKNNPIAIIIPCHRVIAKSGDLQGYFYGLDMKRKLLAMENPLSFAEQGVLF